MALMLAIDSGNLKGSPCVPCKVLSQQPALTLAATV